MNVTFYTLPGKVGLKFMTTPERDKFWNSIPVQIQSIAEKIGALTIRFYPEKLSAGGYSVSLETIALPEPTTQTPSAAPVAPANEGRGQFVDVSKVANPFAITGQNVVKSLPGLVNVQSNIPPEELKNLGGEPVQPVQPAPTPTVVNEPKVEAPVAVADPEPTGIHKNSRKYREWKARQK